jgi:glycosyltransferase involved in cell wall biosynthesis
MISVLTPVYNGERYLAECIQSVIRQEYENWEYHIVNNCSTDCSLEIAESYARKDRRIQVRTNREFVGIIENHNIAFRSISPQSRYTKVVSADDWITPDCLRKMVRFAREHPTVGIIGAYQRSGDGIRWQGLPRATSVLSGRDACRLALLHGVPMFGAPTAFLYRSDLVRMTDFSFPHTRPHADTSVCYEYLQHSDFGFLHEVLSAERLHPGQASSDLYELNAGSLAYLEVLLQYGPRFLNESEFADRKREVFEEYYRLLGGCVLKLKGREFWRFHSSGLRDLGCRMDWGKIGMATIREFMTESKNPRTAFRKAVGAIRAIKINDLFV